MAPEPETKDLTAPMTANSGSMFAFVSLSPESIGSDTGQGGCLHMQ